MEQGFLLDSSDTSLKSANDWVSAVPSLSLSERAKSGSNVLLGGHAFAREHEHAVELPGAVGVKRAKGLKSTRSLTENGGGEFARSSFFSPSRTAAAAFRDAGARV